MTRVAVLGLGSIGMRHARNLLELGASVTGFDPEPARRNALREAGGEVVERLDDALEGAQGALVCSPSHWHLTHLEAAIGAGCHVFVEKPLAHSDTGLDLLVDRAEAEDRVIANGLMLRFHPAVERARDLVHGGGIGRLLWARFQCSSYLPGWRPKQDYRKGYAADPEAGGVIFDHVHEFDLACHLLGPAAAVGASARHTGLLEIPSEDCADAILTHGQDVQSTIHVDYVTRPAKREAVIMGTDGWLRIDLIGRRLEHGTVGDEVIEDEEFPGGFDDDYRAEMQEFLACMQGRIKPRCGGREALAVLRTVLKVRALAELPGCDRLKGG